MKRGFAGACAPLMLAVLIAAGIPSRVQAQSTSPGAFVARMDTFLTRSARFGFSGNLLLAYHGDVVSDKSYGMADRANRIPLTPQTPLSIGSLSKQFTAAAILKLVQDGKLSLHDTLGALLPDVPRDKAGIDVRALLTHTSGLPYLPDDMFKPGTRSEIIHDLLRMPLDSTAIGRWSYSTPGYTLAAAVVERVTGMRYESFIEQALFRPAGMTHTTFLSDTAHVPVNGVHSYDRSIDEGSIRTLPLAVRTFGAGDVFTTTGDLFRWITAVRHYSILDSATTALFFSPQVAVANGNSYGFGWNQVKTRQGTTAILHAGDFAGYNAELRMYTSEGWDAIILSNARDNGRGYRTVAFDALRHLVSGETLAMPPKVISGVKLDGFSGTYTTSASDRLDIIAMGDSLRVVALTQNAAGLLLGTDTAATRWANERNRAFQSIVNASVVDTSALRRWLDRSVAEESKRVALEQLRDWVATNHAAVLNTTATAPGEGVTLLAGRGSAGKPVTMSLLWSRDAIANYGPSPDSGVSRTFFPVSETTAVAYDLFTQRQTTLTCRADRSLLLESGDVSAVLRLAERG